MTLKELEDDLERRGLSPKSRKAIRDAKICVVDDHIEDLRSLIAGLRREGFNNVVEWQTVPSVNAIVAEAFDLVILDLKGVAEQVSMDDGIGVLKALKNAEPALPVLIVSGSTLSPESSRHLSCADAIRSKPLLPAELAAEVAGLLRSRKDQYWAALGVLKELRRLHPEIAEQLRWSERLRLSYLQWRLARDLKREDTSPIPRILKIAGILSRLGVLTARIVGIAQGISGRAG